MTLHACDDDLTQDLAELECDAVLHQVAANPSLTPLPTLP
jgi:hypothetical protein